MAKELLPDLENRKLDTLAAHYGLTFEARHRSIGDVKVTTGVLAGLFAREAKTRTTWSSIQPFTVANA
jgi:DNA polymerase III epsilon subunit-like protein